MCLCVNVWSNGLLNMHLIHFTTDNQSCSWIFVQINDQDLNEANQTVDALFWIEQPKKEKHMDFNCINELMHEMECAETPQ